MASFIYSAWEINEPRIAINFKSNPCIEVLSGQVQNQKSPQRFAYISYNPLKKKLVFNQAV